MMFETVGQSSIFLAMMYAGLCVGLLYDGLRMVRRLLAANALVTAFFDLLFWLAAAAVAAVALALRGEGALRFYSLAGCASGMVLYLLGISRVLRAIGQAIVRSYRRAEESPKWQAKLEKQRQLAAEKVARKQEKRKLRQAKPQNSIEGPFKCPIKDANEGSIEGPIKGSRKGSTKNSIKDSIKGSASNP